MAVPELENATKFNFMCCCSDSQAVLLKLPVLEFLLLQQNTMTKNNLDSERVFLILPYCY